MKTSMKDGPSGMQVTQVHATRILPKHNLCRDFGDRMVLFLRGLLFERKGSLTGALLFAPRSWFNAMHSALP